MSGKRVTVMMPIKLDKLVREKQANQIKKTAATYSYSQALAEVVAKGLGVKI